jgi:hypothetical protein
LKRGVGEAAPARQRLVNSLGPRESPPRVGRTGGIGEEQLELRDDGDIDGLQLTGGRSASARSDS